MKSKEEILCENWGKKYGSPSYDKSHMKINYTEVILPAMEQYAQQFKQVNGLQGEWQLCPKCNGDGNLARYNSSSIISTDADLLCDVCNGAKIIAKPIN